ncbi:MAG: methyltransferase, partial [Propionicimonas sp.]|nr:methyltransferase [Propionicimonas sp.]
GMLQDYAERVAAHAAGTVRLLAGGREKHLTRGMNEVLGRSFSGVRASLGRQKSRVLHAWGPLPGASSWPRTSVLEDTGLTVVSHAGAFAAERLDGGTRLLLDALGQGLGASAGGGPRGAAVDLGCGTGILASWLAGQGFEVTAIDVSRAASASARATAAANGVAVEVLRADGLAGRPSGSADLVVCNPPFHRGTAKDSTPGFELLRGAVPALAVGAEVWTVFNSHLPYLPFLRAEVGPTRVVARDRQYTVTRSTRRPA